MLKQRIMKRRNSLTILLLLFNVLVYSQSTDIKRTHHWYFGENAGIDFTSGTAVADTSGNLNTLEGCASISDTSGNLLFYTDGIKVWDSTHAQMPNGFGLHGDWSSLNSTIIVPNPSIENIYYVFTTPAYAGHWTGFKALEYSIVDMSLNGGLGDVTTKNITLFTTATEQLGVVRHKNNIDYWVVAHQDSSSNFMSYLVTASGVLSTPVISNIGKYVPPYSASCWGCAVSGLKFSPSGCRLAVTYPNCDTLQIFDFDNNTGAVINPITLNFPFPWSACFSPDNNLLYVGSFDYNITQDRVYQFNLSSNTQSGIMASKTLLSTVTGSMATMQIAPDGKIYCTKYQDNYLAVINNPNITGAGCNFVANGFYLGGKLSLSGITNFVQSYFVNDTIDYSCPSVGITELIDGNSISIYPNPFSSQTTLQASDYFHDVTLKVYNYYGYLLKQVDNIYGELIIMQRDNLTKGIYFVQLTQSNKLITVKVVIVD